MHVLQLLVISYVNLVTTFGTVTAVYEFLHSVPVGRVTKPSLTRHTDYKAPNSRMMNELERVWKEMVVFLIEVLPPGIYVERRKKTKEDLRIRGVQPKIRIEHPCMSQQHYSHPIGL
jgi:hypothetical protein